MRRLSTTTRRTGALALGLSLVALALASLVGGPAGAQDAGADTPSCGDRAEAGGGRLAVVTVSGLLDPVLARFVDRSIDDAEDAEVSWLVLQVNSKGTVVSDARVAELVERVRTADVPVAVWVGPSGTRATKGVAQIAAVACEVGVAPGSRLGDLGDPVVDPERFTPAFQENLDRIEDGTVDSDTALDLGLASREAPVLGTFLIDLDGVETEVVEDEEGRPQRQVTGDSIPVFSKLPIVDQLLHTVSSPAVAYLLLLAGLALIVFELFTAGIGVAGVVGAACTILGCYGLANLPARGWAVGLLVLTVVAYAVDVQTGVPRVWTGVGTAALVVGSFSLYEGLSLSWITLLVGIAGMLIFVIGAMPAMVRTRFSTPTIGRGWMIGEEGEAVTEVAPEGVVRVRGAPWRARTNRATPVPAGEAVRVVEVDGLLLEVEPLEGGAKDHRERARKE
ncbi:MAG TPA: NfeD family protein [Iamia sp.]|nr:NfeD family protein [Iamia sp.]